MSPFDAYRVPKARDLMVEFTMSSRGIDKPRAVAELRTLNHVGLAYVYQDAAAGGRGHQVDYDPCVVGRG